MLSYYRIATCEKLPLCYIYIYIYIYIYRFHFEQSETQTTDHDDVIKWKLFPRYWPFVRGIHRSLVKSALKGQWRGALMFSLICARIYGWVNNGEAGDLRRHRDYYHVIVMFKVVFSWSNSVVHTKGNWDTWRGLAQKTWKPTGTNKKWPDIIELKTCHHTIKSMNISLDFKGLTTLFTTKLRQWPETLHIF